MTLDGYNKFYNFTITNQLKIKTLSRIRYRDQYNVNKELLAIQDYTLYTTPLNEENILSRIIRQFVPDFTKILSILGSPRTR